MPRIFRFHGYRRKETDNVWWMSIWSHPTTTTTTIHHPPLNFKQAVFIYFHILSNFLLKNSRFLPSRSIAINIVCLPPFLLFDRSLNICVWATNLMQTQRFLQPFKMGYSNDSVWASITSRKCVAEKESINIWYRVFNKYLLLCNLTYIINLQCSPVPFHTMLTWSMPLGHTTAYDSTMIQSIQLYFRRWPHLHSDCST